MRSQQQIAERITGQDQQRMIGRQRFIFIRVQRCPGQLSAFKRVDKRLLIDDAATASRDQIRAARHFGQHIGIEQVVCFGGIGQQYDQDLEALRSTILEMGGLAEEMVHNAVRVLTNREEEMVAEVLKMENRVNDLHIEIDDRCLKLIALHQPAAGDLRLIAAAIKINSDLERIADQAVNIAETATFLCRVPRIKLGDIPRMVELATEMTRDSLDAFSKRDVDLARSVIARDDEEDRLKSETFNELLAMMQSDTSTIQRALDIILIARNLERIADHATNIAEDVIFMVLAKDIRHHAEDRIPTQPAQ